MTGGGRGPCGGGMGNGFGFGRGFGRGRGRGFGPGWGGLGGPYPATADEEGRALRAQADSLKSTLENIEARLRKLESEDA